MILIIDKHCSTIDYDRGNLKLSHSNGSRRVPLKMLEQVVVYGNPLITARALRELAAACIPSVFTTSRGANRTALIGRGFSGQLQYRTLQHSLAADAKTRLSVAKWVVKNKRQSYTLALDEFDPGSGNPQANTDRFVARCQRAADSIASANSSSSLLGVEGQLAQAWFALLARQLPSHWRFTGRNRRPPRDPVNAMLSLGYTLLGCEVRECLIGHGLDPALGFLHSAYPGRDSMALDLTELFRSAVDAFVIQMVLTEKFRPSDFSFHNEYGCRLKKKMRGNWYAAWANYRYHWPRLLAVPPTSGTVTPESSVTPGETLESNDENTKHNKEGKTGTYTDIAELPTAINHCIMVFKQVLKHIDQTDG